MILSEPATIKFMTFLSFGHMVLRNPVHQRAAVSYAFFLLSFLVPQQICQNTFYSVSFIFLYQHGCVSSFTHSVNDLFNGVQANDARAFLVGPCIPGFTLYGRQTDSVTASHQHKRPTTINTDCAPIRHPFSVQLSTPINRSFNYRTIIFV